MADGIEPQTAAWTIDALSLYTAAYALEISLVAQRQSQQDDGWIISRDERDELVRRFTALPTEQFPQTRR